MIEKQKRRRLRLSRKLWDLPRAFALVSDLQPDLLEAGWSAGITGSVLYKNISYNDLDLILYPLSTADRKATKKAARAVLTKHGLVPHTSVQKVRAHWRKTGSKDTKHVEVWMLERRRVDVFMLK